MKKLLLLLPVLLLGITSGLIAKTWTVKFDKSFIDAAQGQESKYRFEFLRQRGKEGKTGLFGKEKMIIPVVLNMNNVPGNTEIYTKMDEGAHGIYVSPLMVLGGGPVMHVNTIDNGFKIKRPVILSQVASRYATECVDKLEITAESGPLQGQTYRSAGAKGLGCYSQTFTIKVENGKLTIDQSKDK